ncbi:hypothetical protein Tco_0977708 [Tanacetum coccineum]|uniref:Uncharacterized protein n=1 Tax=Tanacetum coccineum TaxID=301880 RepID=A0ABQ5EKW4_9ASTR
MTTPTPPPIIETTNPLSTLPDFASVFRFNYRITTLEKEVAKLKKDPLHTQVTTLVNEHLDTRLGETIEEFMNFISESRTTRIKEQVKDQLLQILPKEVSITPCVAFNLLRDALSAIIGIIRTQASDEELEELMKDQPLSADASPTALSPGYIADSNPEEDKEDPEEDPADHPADG